MFAARRLEDGTLGPVYERSFTGFPRDAEVEAALESATRVGALVEFRIEGAALVTRRRWFESTPLDQLFRDADDAERRRNSRTVFSRLVQELGRLASAGLNHGGVHPGNVLIAGGGLQLVDAVANSTRLGFGVGRPPQGWLWGVGRPEGVNWHDWDRANLLRMATLLGLPAQQDGRAEGPTSVLDRCRAWAVGALEALPTGSDMGQAIEQALVAAELIVGTLAAPPRSPVDLAKRDVFAPSLPPSPGPVVLTKTPERPTAPERVAPPAPVPAPALVAAPAPVASPERSAAPAAPDAGAPAGGESESAVVEALAEGTFRGTSGLRMLHTHLEEQLMRIADARGVPPTRTRALLAHWLRRRSCVREEELVEAARLSVRAGTHFQVWVPRNVLMNAQRAFTQYGVAAHDAEVRVAAVLQELGLSDEREGERRWHACLDAYVQKNCPKKTFSPKQRTEMCAQVTSFGVPRELAEEVTNRFLDEHKFVEKKGWFG